MNLLKRKSKSDHQIIAHKFSFFFLIDVQGEKDTKC